MASASNISMSSTSGGSYFSSPPLNQLLNQVTSIKLDRSNFLLWKNLALPILRSYKLEGHLFGTKTCPPMYLQSEETSGAASSGASGSSGSSSTTGVTLNPQYEAWNTIDQLLLGWLYNSMAPEIATQVMGHENAKDLWDAIQLLYGIQSRAEEDYLRQTFQQTRKGNQKMSDYLRLMKCHADNLGQAGSPVSNRALISQVLLGLDEEYNPVVATIQGKADAQWADIHNELLVFEKRLEFQNTQQTNGSFLQNSSVNMVINNRNGTTSQRPQQTSTTNNNRSVNNTS